MPGRSTPPSAKAQTTRKVPLPESTTGATRSTVPVKALPGSASTAMLHRQAGLQRGQFALGHVEHGLQARDVDDAEDRRVDLHEVAGLDRARGDHAGDRRGDVGVATARGWRMWLAARAFFQVVAQLVVVVGAEQLLLGHLLGAARSWPRACASARRSARPAARTRRNPGGPGSGRPGRAGLPRPAPAAPRRRSWRPPGLRPRASSGAVPV